MTSRRRCIVAVIAILIAAISASAERAAQKPAAKVQALRAQVVTSYPHDRMAFTQGLLLHQGMLYESTGLVGQSTLRQVELATGRVMRKIDVPPPIFAEGLALVGDQLIQLTWQDGRALVYDPRTFAKQREFSYRGEGWGLCYDGREIVMSDGSANLTFRRTADFSVIRTQPVTMNGKPVEDLNELECAEGFVYANVWMVDQIVKIDPATGHVVGDIDARNLLSPLDKRGADAVLNGIAYDPADKTFLITGKLWPRLFRVKFVAAAG